ncbi:MAG: adenine phosphoribosyltransferase [Planctomycetota bacterium]|jgi:adenine phosphoribosyltransferase
MELASLIRDIPDYPKEGIVFKDIMPLVENGPAFRQAIDELAALFADSGAEIIVGAEARGFIFGAALAYKMNLGFAAVRKPGKLPYKCREVSYDLEYGSDTLCMHEDALEPGKKVLVIDDLLATGGTIGATIQMIEEAKAEVVGIGFLIELDFLGGRAKLGDHNIQSLIHVE